jgi:hypothetical protein
MPHSLQRISIMPKYRVIKKSWLHASAGPRLYQPGEIIEYDGEPGVSLEPLDEDAVAARQRARPGPGRLPNGLQGGPGL